MSQVVPPPGARRVKVKVPPPTPLMETSARSPPLLAGSIVTAFVTEGAPCGVCSQTPRLPVSKPLYDRAVRPPPFLVMVALTIPLSRVHEVPLSVIVTAGSALAGEAFCAKPPDAARNAKTKTAHATNESAPLRQEIFMERSTEGLAAGPSPASGFTAQPNA